MKFLPFTFLFFAFFSAKSQAKLVPEAEIKWVRVNGELASFQKDKPFIINALGNDLVFELTNVAVDSFDFHLSGFDAKWYKNVYPTTRYTILKGGEYTLEYKTEKNGVASKTNYQKIIVERDLAEEWWFYPSLAFYAVMLVGVIFFFRSVYNLNKKLNLETIRNQIASDLHDEVGSNLSSVAISLHSAERKLEGAKPELKTLLGDIRATSEEIVLSLRDTVWMINPDNDSVERLFEKMRSFAVKILAPQGILLDFDNKTVNQKPLKISMEQRYNAYMMFKEAVNNLAKHSEATLATVKIEQNKEAIFIEINDNGKGFVVAENHDGNGLRNFERRSKLSLISIEVKSTPSVGTTIRMEIPEF